MKPEFLRKFFVSLKRKPQNIPLVAVTLCFIWYSFNLTTISFTTTRLQGNNMGLTGFAIMLFSTLAVVCCLNAFPYRKKVKIPMLVLLYVMLAIVLYCDFHYIRCVTDKLAQNIIGQVTHETEMTILAKWRTDNLMLVIILLIVIWGFFEYYFIHDGVSAVRKEKNARKAFTFFAVALAGGLTAYGIMRVVSYFQHNSDDMLNAANVPDIIRTVVTARQIMFAHMIMIIISTVLVATLPLYRKLIRKINTSVAIEENAEMEAIDISGE